jgi:hypothetical protein
LLLRAGRLPPLPGQRRWAAGLVVLLWVRTWDTAQENLAVEILKRQSARDVHVHLEVITG